MIKDKEVEFLVRNMDIIKFRNLGYDIPKQGYYQIKVEHMNQNSYYEITICCDDCGTEKISNFKLHNTGIKHWGKYYCTRCVKKYMDHDSAAQTRKVTNITKYGVEHTLQSKDIRDKGKITSMEKYGTENVFQSDYFKERKKNTMIERYGVEHSSHCEESNIKRDKTNIEKYGTIMPMASKENIDKINQKTKEKYSQILDPERYLILDYKSIKENHSGLFTIHDLKYDQTFEISHQILYKRLTYGIPVSTIENPINSGCSNGELNLKEFITSLGIPYINNDKKILRGKEVDIYIPSHNLAIEYNGLYWHSDMNRTPIDYHRNKSIGCREKGVWLFHVYEDDWREKTDIVKSIILGKLGLLPSLNTNNTIIREIGEEESNTFVTNNYIKNMVEGNINLGLYINNELCYMVSFIGNTDHGYTITDYFGKNGFKIDGFGEILEFFKKNYRYEYIKALLDFGIYDGKEMDSNNFELEEITEPTHYWVQDTQSNERIRIHNFERVGTVKPEDNGKYFKIYSAGYVIYRML